MASEQLMCRFAPSNGLTQGSQVESCLPDFPGFEPQPATVLPHVADPPTYTVYTMRPELAVESPCTARRLPSGSEALCPPCS